MKLDLSPLARFPAPIRIAAFLVILLLLWAPLAGPIALLVKDSNTASIVTLVLLYIEFIFLVRVWGQQVYQQPHLLWRYGLEFTQRYGLEWLSGLTIGLFSLMALFITQGLLGWLIWKAPAAALLPIALQGLLMAAAIGFAEELLFRGWLLDELQRNYRPQVALWVDACIYALVHGLRPQLPALVLLGATLVCAKWSRSELQRGWRRGRLGLPMGLHSGLVWGYYIVNVGQLFDYSGQVPTWITGLDRNPLAGAIGLLFMTILAFGMVQFSKRQTSRLSF